MEIDFLNQGPKAYDEYEDIFNDYYVKIFEKLKLMVNISPMLQLLIIKRFIKSTVSLEMLTARLT